jgi:2-dehydropantoate 2-reductase
MPKKVLFVGAGAIGSYLGSFLTRAGHDVTLVDPWAQAVDTINARGISVTGPHDPFTAKPIAVHLNDAQRLPRDFEIAFVAMKVYDTAWATQLAIRHLRDDGYVVASENCWPDPIVASVAGAHRSIGLIMSKIGVASWKPGEVERGMEKGGTKGHDVFRAGEHDGKVTKRTEEVAEMLRVVDGAYATDNLWGERWSKLCANSMGNPVQGMSGLGSGEIASSEVGRAWVWRSATRSRSSTAPRPRSGRPRTSARRGRSWTACSRRRRRAAATGARPWRRTSTRGARRRSTT